jgi:hypothetical protein
MGCPKCGLINPDSAERCDCGYDFASGQMKLSYANPRSHDDRLAQRPSRRAAT